MGKGIIGLIIFLVILAIGSAKPQPNDCGDYNAPFRGHKSVLDFFASYGMYGSKTFLENDAERVKKAIYDIFADEHGINIPEFWKIFDEYTNPKFFPQLVPRISKCTLNLPTFASCFARVTADVCQHDSFFGKDA